MKNIDLKNNCDNNYQDLSDSVRRYYHDIRNYESCDPFTEKEKFDQIHKGNEKIKQEMIESHTKFVVAVAKKYVCSNIGFADLIQEGNIALIKAIDNFDPTMGARFGSYAVKCIQGTIINYIKQNRRILSSVSAAETVLPKIKKIQDDFVKKNGYEIPLEDIHESYNDNNSSSRYLNAKDIKDILEYDQNHVAIDENTPDKDSLSPSNQEFYIESIRKDFIRVLNTLTNREKEVLVDYYGICDNEKLDIKEIGDKHNLPGYRVLQILEKGIRRMKHTSRKNILIKYLGV